MCCTEWDLGVGGWSGGHVDASLFISGRNETDSTFYFCSLGLNVRE